MSSLFSILGTTAGTLQTLTKAFAVSQENVANASTPGYAREIQNFVALPFDPASGSIGGVTSSEIQSTRDLFAESNVQAQNSRLGIAEQQVASLTSLQSNFDISGASGIPAALSSLSSSFSAWSVNPNDTTARQAVITSAQNLAGAFRATADSVSQIASDNQTQAKGLVAQINGYAASIAADNARIQAGGGNDPANSADLYNNLQNLSELTNVTTLNQSDGSVTVLLGGQTTLVAGSQQYAISAAVSIPSTPQPTYLSAPPNTQIVDSQGNDITSTITAGKLGGVLTVLNQTLPSIEGDSSHAGSLNQLAQAFADNVNGILTAGNVTDGPPAQAGTPLFSYDTANVTNSAASLTIDPGATAAGLAAIAPANAAATPPVAEVSNGIALALAGVATNTGQIGGQSYTQFFGSIAAGVGSALSTATTGKTAQASLLAQAKSLRQQSSGVDLNQEAVTITELQTSIGAASKLFGVIDTLMQTIINLIQ